MRKGIIPLMILTVFLLTSSAKAIGGGPTDHLRDPVPDYGEEDVVITDKGVQTCINVTLDVNCTVNLTFQWWNNSAGDWGQWETYGYLENVSTSGQYCFWNINVSCATENFWSTWFHWRVMGNFTCAQTDYSEIMYSYFNPEDCPLFYIYPIWNSTDICPCCDAMCIGVNNVAGHNMNLTFYRNDFQFESFYFINQLLNVSNGTYCFCIDGHINNSNYYPMMYNTTYHWHVNVTDISTGEYNISDIFSFRTAEHVEDCPCSEEDIIAICEDTDTIRDDAWLVGLIVVFGGLIFVLNRRRRKK